MGVQFVNKYYIVKKKPGTKAVARVQVVLYSIKDIISKNYIITYFQI